MKNESVLLSDRRVGGVQSLMASFFGETIILYALKYPINYALKKTI